MVTILIAVALAADAFAVSVVCGASDRTVKLRTGIITAAMFGIFQCLMPVLGWSIGTVGSKAIDGFDHIAAFGILVFIGIKMIYDSRGGSAIQSFSDIKTLFTLSFATSIDALTVGVTLPSVAGAKSFPMIMLTSLIIGGVTFVMCVAGFFIGKSAGHFKPSFIQMTGGGVLIFLGIKALIEG